MISSNILNRKMIDDNLIVKPLKSCVPLSYNSLKLLVNECTRIPSIWGLIKGQSKLVRFLAMQSLGSV